ncbi:hypothetical protein EJD97_009057, partial [Solanum chilense]
SFHLNFMIEKALQDWMKKGILVKTQYPSLSTKEYDNLPRGHTTLLKHHLQKMCEKVKSL